MLNVLGFPKVLREEKKASGEASDHLWARRSAAMRAESSLAVGIASEPKSQKTHR